MRRPLDTTYRELLGEPRPAALLGLHGVLALHDSVLVVGLPAWVLATAVTPAISPALFALNTVLVVALQVRVARWFARSGGPVGYTRTGLLLGMACLAFALSSTVPRAAAVGVLVGAVVLLTLGETGHTGAEAWLAVSLTEGRTAGTVIGLLKTAMSVQQAFGPLLVVLLLTVGGRVGWVVLAALLLAAALLSRRLAAADLRLGRAVDPAPKPSLATRSVPDPLGVRLGGATPRRGQELGLAVVGVEADLPRGVVEDAVVFAADEDEVVQAGRAAVGPMHDVVGVTHHRWAGAAWEGTVPVAGHEGAPQCGGDQSGRASDVEDLAVGPQADRDRGLRRRQADGLWQPRGAGRRR